MKIKKREYLGLMLNTPQAVAGLKSGAEELWLNSCQNCLSEGSQRALESIEFLTRTADALFSGVAKDYLLSKRSIEVINNIKIGRTFDLSIIQQLHKRPLNIMVNKDRAIRYDIVDDTMVVLYMVRPEGDVTGDAITTGMYMLDLTRSLGDTVCMINDSPVNDEEAVYLAMRIILFLKLTDPEMIFLPAGKKSGARPFGYANDSDTSVTIVDSTWNKYIVRTEGFGVSGHFRAQRHGKENREIKLIWIQPFQKHGYIRRPKAA